MLGYCTICGKQFEKTRSTNITCSKECSLKHKSNVRSLSRDEKRAKEYEDNKVTNCLVCGVEFERKKTNVWRTQKYCSPKCRKKAERLFGNKKQTDLENKDKIRFGGNKYVVLERDKYECQICGNKAQLVIHHKKLDGQNGQSDNDVSNLITLCRKCHINLHRSGLS